MRVETQTLDNFDSFHNHVTDTFFEMSCQPVEKDLVRYRSIIQSRSMNQLGVVDISGDGINVQRRREHFSSVEVPQYLVKFQAEGEVLVRHRRQEAHLRPGDFVLCSNTEPYELHFPEHYRQIVLAVPQAALNEAVREPESFLGQRMDARVGANGLLSQMVQSLGPMIDHMDPILASKLENNVFDLLATALEHGQNAPRLDHDGVKTEHLFRIKSFIRKHLADPGLCPDRIAKAHEISTRYLHMLFNNENTSVSRYIQRQRLDACRTSLDDPAMGIYTITEIAFRWGFNDASHFNRVFKAAFGQTPRQYRVSQNPTP
ncbi:MAG: helix-turn-helix domain-containing protein [Cellvibrionaceae bacterium]|nr:helix-turn-helix domain-containing protein [Cellvibrionaceae bacterium]